MKSIAFDAVGHRFRLQASLWSGVERFFCDDALVSEKRSLFYVTPHVFQLSEGGEQATYELNVLTGWLGFDYGYILRRNGIPVAHKP